MDSFLRPFARRALMTRRPFFVFILARKPCVRLRGVLCGWYVLFIKNLSHLVNKSYDSSKNWLSYSLNTL